MQLQTGKFFKADFALSQLVHRVVLAEQQPALSKCAIRFDG
jgi:hypothetical protein